MSIRLRRYPSAALGCAAFLLVACSGDRPQSSDAFSATMLPPAIDTLNSDAALPSTVVVGPCTPGDWVPCHMYYRDISGRLQCPMGTALCRPDGTATYPCGEWVHTPDGPRPLDAGADAELLNE